MKIINFFRKTKERACKFGRTLGPGFVTGAADDDPSGIGTYSLAGAKYGLMLAWLVPFQLPFMFAIQEMCARIGLMTGKGLAANMKELFPKVIVYGAVGILVFANVANIGADIAIMAESATLVLGCKSWIWACCITLGIIMMEVFIPYHFYSKILMWSSVFLLSYVATAFMTTHHWMDVMAWTITPHMLWNADFILLATGFIGTTISPYLFFWQASHEIEDSIDHGVISAAGTVDKNVIKKMRIDTFIGMFFSQLISLFIVVTCFSTLHVNGITDINTASDAALALKPLAGEWAYLLFTLGIIGSGFIGIPVLAGSTAYALSEIFGQKGSLALTYKQAPFFYAVIVLSTLAGLGMNIINISPVKALLYAAVINGIASIPFIIFILILANKKDLMGENKNRHISNIAGGLTFSMMLLSTAFFIIFF